MEEMTVNNNDIAEYGARLYTYTVGGTALTRITSTSYNANLPKLFNTDYGQREIKITLVFRSKHYNSGGIIARLRALAAQKSAFDSLISSGTVDIGLPDGFYYCCILDTIGTEEADGESLEVTYTLNGVRHLPLAEIEGKTIECASTVNTDCRITINVGSGWTDGNTLTFVIYRADAAAGVPFHIYNVSPGDVIVIDGMSSVVTINGSNAFGSTDIVTFPYLCPGTNKYTQSSSGNTFMTEYYPTFI